MTSVVSTYKTAHIGASTPYAGLTTNEREVFEMAEKIIPTPCQLRELLTYDPNTGKLFFKKRPLEAFPSARLANSWNSRCAGKEACSTYSNGYKVGPILGTLMIAHRVAWAIYHGEWPDGDIDHINQVKSDNRISNLRIATDSENLRNIPMFSTNTSGYKGVSRDKKSGMWVARVSDGSRYRYLGRFHTPEAASAAYISAAKKHHGEFFTTRMIRDDK